MLKQLIAGIVASSLIAGCTTHTYKIDVYDNQEFKRKPGCPAFQLPEDTGTPPLPLEELKRLNPKDQAGHDRLMLKHIEALRIHIKGYKKEVRKAYEEYQKDCKRQPKK